MYKPFQMHLVYVLTWASGNPWPLDLWMRPSRVPPAAYSNSNLYTLSPLSVVIVVSLPKRSIIKGQLLISKRTSASCWMGSEAEGSANFTAINAGKLPVKRPLLRLSGVARKTEPNPPFPIKAPLNQRSPWLHMLWVSSSAFVFTIPLFCSLKQSKLFVCFTRNKLMILNKGTGNEWFRVLGNIESRSG